MSIMLLHEHSHLDYLLKSSLFWQQCLLASKMGVVIVSWTFFHFCLLLIFILHYCLCGNSWETVFSFICFFWKELMFLSHTYDVVDWSSSQIWSPQCNHLLDNVLSIMIGQMRKVHILPVLRSLWPDTIQEDVEMPRKCCGISYASWDTIPHQKLSCMDCEGYVTGLVWSRYCYSSAHDASLWLYSQYHGGYCQGCLSDQTSLT